MDKNGTPYVMFGKKKVDRASYPNLHRFLSSGPVNRNNAVRGKEAGGLEDNYTAAQTAFIAGGDACVQLASAFLSEKPLIIVTAELCDAETGRLMETFADYAEDSLLQIFNLISGDPDSQKTFSRPISLKAHFKWKNADKSEQTADCVFSNSAYFGSEPIITDISVTAPVAKDGKTIYVGYGRDVPSADYSYPQVQTDKTHISIHLPFCGSVQVSPDFKVEQVIPDDSTVFELYRPELTLLFSDGGAASYNNGTIASKFTVDSSGNTVSWSFPYTKPAELKGGTSSELDDWCTTADLSHFTASTTASFWSKFSLLISYRKDPSFQQVVTVTVSSTNTAYPDDSSSKFIPSVYIQWGCFAGHTQILCADGTERVITGIRAGDRIALYGGGTAVVSDVISGTEKELVHIRTVSGKTLEVTGSHPVMTERGTVAALRLSPADRIITGDGVPESVDELFMIPYSGKVYSLKLQDPGMIIAGGLAAGDFDTQNTALEAGQKPEYPEEIMQLRQEIEKLFAAGGV
ncbi:MAG TPA: hypothetical protein DCL73_03515 [Treponema sp.]|nr:hypothetical protein [Treponema sp.]